MGGFDYSSCGAYFVTICSHDRKNIFGEIVDGKMELNRCGNIVEEEWLKSAILRNKVSLDLHVVMPNHLH